MYALKWIFIEPLRFVVQCFVWPFVIIPRHAGRGLWTIWPFLPLTYICFCIAIDDWSFPYRDAVFAAGWMSTHTALLYLLFRCVCLVFVSSSVVVMAGKFLRTVLAPAPQILQPLKEIDNRYTTGAIDNFRDASPYGDASHAERHDIAQALAGSGGAGEPFFES